MEKNFLHHYAKFVAFATFILIVAGGLVTSTGSGLSVPDWPLSYGRLFPPMVGGIRFEHTHRVIAGFVAICSFILMILTLVKEQNRVIRLFGFFAFITVIFQAILGGLTVLYLLPTWISAFHASLGQTFFCLVTSIAIFTSQDWLNAKPIPSKHAGSIQRLLCATTGFVYLQLILGSIIRHSEHAAIRPHFYLAILIAMHVLFITFKIMKDEGARDHLAGHTMFLNFAVTMQIFLGFGSFFYTRVLLKGIQPTSAEVLLRTAHQTVGAIILVTIFTLTLRAFRFLKPAN